MRKSILLCLVVLLSGCAATGNSDRCIGGCWEARQQLMGDVIHNRPFGP